MPDSHFVFVLAKVELFTLKFSRTMDVPNITLEKRAEAVCNFVPMSACVFEKHGHLSVNEIQVQRQIMCAG